MKTLYKLDKKRNIITWEIIVLENTYFVRSGRLGNSNKYRDTTCTPKNVGRSNETTAEQQALKEASALWLKQRDRECYLENISDEPHHIEPMLALDYSKVPHRLDWKEDRVYGQAKLDGVRAIYTSDYKDTLQSRKGVRYPLIKQAEQLLFVQSQLGITFPIDGEVYKHGYPLNRIHAAATSENELTDDLDFYIFDIVANGIPYEQRRTLLESINAKLLPPNIKILTASEILKENVQSEHDRMVRAGFEGIMLKGGSGLYERGFRSDKLFKYKNFEEEEFLIIDVISDKEGQGIIVYETDYEDSTYHFKSRMRGTNEERKELLENKEHYVGKRGTVRFFKYTEYGIPQFPVTIAINQDK